MMKGDITLTVRLNPKAQGHLSELIKIHPEKSRNKLICLAIENASIEDEKEKIAIDVLEQYYQKKIYELMTHLANKGVKEWNRLCREIPYTSPQHPEKLWNVEWDETKTWSSRSEYLRVSWLIPIGFKWKDLGGLH